MTDKKLATFIQERNSALLTGNLKIVMAFQRKYNPNARQPSSFEVAEAAMHKAITAVLSLPIEHRRKSKAWLLARGYKSEDDGEL